MSDNFFLNTCKKKFLGKKSKIFSVIFFWCQAKFEKKANIMHMSGNPTFDLEYYVITPKTGRLVNQEY